MFAPMGVLGFGAEALAAGEPARFEVRFRDRAGSLTRILRVAGPATAVTPEAIQRRLNGYGPSGSAREFHEAWADAGGTADSIPHFQRLEFDGAGRLWVQRFPVSDLDRGAWIVFGADGRPVARAETPPISLNGDGASLKLFEIANEHLIGVHRDSLGVQRLAAYRVDENGG
jgi:hypothetical protein